jgi:hypothetical protein
MIRMTVERFIHNANIELYSRLLAESERDPSRDEDRYNILLRLLAEEEAKHHAPVRNESLRKEINHVT